MNATADCPIYQWRECPHCEGTGKVLESRTVNHSHRELRLCEVCAGIGACYVESPR